MESEKALELKRRSRELFAPFPVLFAYVYGSEARGDSTALSDLDVAVMLQGSHGPRETLRLELAVAGAIDKAVPEAKSDVRSLGSLPLIVRGRMLTEGCLIYSTDEPARVAYETSVRSEYFDFLPVYRAYQEESLARMRRSAGG